VSVRAAAAGIIAARFLVLRRPTDRYLLISRSDYLLFGGDIRLEYYRIARWWQ